MTNKVVMNTFYPEDDEDSSYEDEEAFVHLNDSISSFLNSTNHFEDTEQSNISPQAHEWVHVLPNDTGPA